MIGAWGILRHPEEDGWDAEEGDNGVTLPAHRSSGLLPKLHQEPHDRRGNFRMKEAALKGVKFSPHT